MTDETPKILKWRDQKLYRCRLCSFDSFDKARFEQHFATKHPPMRVIDGGKHDETNVPDVPGDQDETKGTE